MSDLSAIVYATRASATALAAMARHARAAADASGVIAHNHRMVAAGRISAESAAIGNRVAYAAKDTAMRQWRIASGRYDRAQVTLAQNPL
jgi:hypothetical protein